MQSGHISSANETKRFWTRFFTSTRPAPQQPALAPRSSRPQSQSRPTPAHASTTCTKAAKARKSAPLLVCSCGFECLLFLFHKTMTMTMPTKNNLIVATPSCPPQQRQPLHNVAFAGAASNPVRDTHDDAKRKVLASRLDYQLAIHDGECLRCALDGFVAIDRARRGIATKPVKTRGQHRSANRPPTSRHTSCGAI